MITGYLSSDEDEDEFGYFYSDPLVKKDETPVFPVIQTKEIREELHSVLEESKRIDLFHRAVDNGDLDELENLISLGVSVDSSGPREWTPLMKACSLGKVEVVQFLLEHGSDSNLRKESFSPLMACCTDTLVPERLKLNCVRLLLENGAEVNSQDKYQTSALMYAAGSGYTDIVTELLAAPNINVNLQDMEQWTALFHAVNNNHIEIVQKLITANSKLKIKDSCNRTALDLALDKELKEVAKLLGYEETETEPNDLKEQYGPSQFLKELPLPNGQGGFSSDVKSILAAYKLYKVKEVSLPDFLNMTAEDLYEIGIKLEHDRHRILKNAIHRYHLCPWKKSSMHQITPGVPMSMEDAVAITGSLAKHLTIANASLRYLTTQISSRLEKDLVMSIEKELISVLVHTYTEVEQMKSKLSKILNYAEKIQRDSHHSADYIPSFKKEKKGSLNFVKYFWCGFGATTAVYLIYYFKTRT